MSDLHLSRSLLNYGPRNVLRNARVFGRIEKDQSRGLSIDIETPTRKAKTSWLTNHLAKEIGSGQFCQAHLPYSVELDDFLAAQGLKMIYIHRHPLDTLLSLKNYILKKKNYPIHGLLKDQSNDEERFKILINGARSEKNWAKAAPFFQKYSNSVQWITSQNVCAVTFEDIIGAKGGGDYDTQIATLNKIVNFLGINPEEALSIQPKVYNPQSETFNKGKIGSWKSEIPAEILEICLERIDSLNINLDVYHYH